jgi:type I restriction enzyme S subunit
MHGSQNTGKERKCITTSNLYWGYFDLKKLKEIRIEEKELSSCTATKGDLLICEGGESGRSAIWEYEYDICFQNHVHRVRPYDGVINYFLYYIMLYLDYSGQINNYRKGMGISNLSGKALSSIIHPLPPSAEQKRIVTKLDELMKLCDNLEASIKESQQQNELLLQQVLREALEPRN